MATTTAYFIISRVQDILQDEESDAQWPVADLLANLHLAQISLISMNPSARATEVALKLASGATQSIPADGISFIEAMYNLGVTGSTYGAAIRKCREEDLNKYRPSWRAVAASATIVNYMFDPDTPNEFLVYPQADGTTYIQIKYSQKPTEVIYDDAGAWETKIISVPDAYASALVDWVLHFAYSKDSDGVNAKKAAEYLASAQQKAGIARDRIASMG